MSNKATRKIKTPAFYEINSDYPGGGPGWKLLNYETLQHDHPGMRPAVAWPDGYLHLPRGPWCLPEFVEMPRLLIDRKLGRPPRDLENIDGLFFISAAMKAVLDAVDSLTCEFRCCETVLPSGEAGRETWLCAVTRAFVGAVNVEGSEGLRVRQGPNDLPAFVCTPARGSNSIFTCLARHISFISRKWRVLSSAIKL